MTAQSLLLTSILAFLFFFLILFPLLQIEVSPAGRARSQVFESSILPRRLSPFSVSAQRFNPCEFHRRPRFINVPFVPRKRSDQKAQLVNDWPVLRFTWASLRIWDQCVFPRFFPFKQPVWIFPVISLKAGGSLSLCVPLLYPHP
ncbi:hypothetical protein LIA77_01843 [Sarocladium implicatum]|nr:hypothetical protein LIA77_01843 [Sarocladium implicatum]